MSKNQVAEDDLRPEYDFSGGVRGKLSRTPAESGLVNAKFYDPLGQRA
jgi:hypothetical protein